MNYDLIPKKINVVVKKNTSPGDVEAQCKSLNSVALLYKMQGSLQSSISFAQKAVSLSANRPRLLTKNLVTLSKLYHLRGGSQHSSIVKFSNWTMISFCKFPILHMTVWCLTESTF